MIFNGKSIQSVVNKNIYPFLNNLLQSEDEAEVREALNNIKLLVDLGIEKKNFPELQRALYHKNINIAHSSFDILRKASPRIKQVEIKTDILESMYPFFCKRALSTMSVSTESLKILDVLIDYDIIGNYKNLQKALLHKNEKVAIQALNVLRKIKRMPIETRIAKVKLVSVERSAGRKRTIVESVMTSLRNLKEQKPIQVIRNKEIEKKAEALPKRS
jgi:hypothetical protein